MNKITTGFQPEIARKQIAEFRRYGEDVDKTLYNALNDLWKTVRVAWCSPKNVEFGDYMNNFAGSIENMARCYNNIAVSATRAYNAYASANNLGRISEDYKTQNYVVANGEGGLSDSVTGENPFPNVGSTGYWHALYDKSPDTGAVGMDKAAMQIAYQEFKKQVNLGINKINDTPYDISFFDEDGLQIATYRSEISKMKDNVTEEFNKICNKLETEMNEEIEVLTLASQAATDALKSTTL